MALSLKARGGFKLAAALAVCGVFFYALWWAPVSRKIARRESELEKVRDGIAKAKRMAARLPKLQKELQALWEIAGDAERRLPKTRPEPWHIDAFEALARKDGVVFSEIMPAKNRAGPFWAEHVFEVRVAASFENLRRFLEDLAREERLVSVTELKLEPKGRAALKLVFYQYRGS